MGADTILSAKRILLGVSGGIAAYKSVELLRLLQKAGADVKVAMTKNAQEFVGRITFEAISGYPVFESMFGELEGPEIRHINWAQETDAVVIAPATANIIGKLAGGIADDALATLMMAVTAPRLLCPSMNTNMYESRALKRNLAVLKEDGFIIVEPGEGALACKTTGPGRLAEPETIVDWIVDALTPKDLAGNRVVVSAGPTREPVDPVRYISNPSSGKMGYAMAKAAAMRGAEVILVSGPASLPDPYNVRVRRVMTAAEMAAAVLDECSEADIVIKTAAVSDYRPIGVSAHKMKKEKDALVMELEKTTDILAELGRRKKPGMILVGFAAETRDLEKYALEKLQKKNLDLIAANIVGENGSGFDSDTNVLHLFFADGSSENLPLMDKFSAANIIIDRIAAMINRHSG